MGKYIKLFDTHSEYETYTADTENFILPNVSYCKDVANEVHYNPYVDPYNGHEYVDLGLPSGTKWATMNVGATGMTDYGLYFQWGDTSGYTASQVGSGEGQKYFGWADYKYGNGTSDPDATGMTKYNATDNLVTLEGSDDAAQANWGGSWRMPTYDEFNELLTASTITRSWATVSTINGYKFSLTTDPTKYVFFPAGGNCNNGNVASVGEYGAYWINSIYDNTWVSGGMDLVFRNNGNCKIGGNHRMFGYPVRGVVG